MSSDSLGEALKTMSPGASVEAPKTMSSGASGEAPKTMLELQAKLRRHCRQELQKLRRSCKDIGFRSFKSFSRSTTQQGRSLDLSIFAKLSSAMPWMAVCSLARNRRSLGSPACRNTGPRLPGNTALQTSPEVRLDSAALRALLLRRLRLPLPSDAAPCRCPRSFDACATTVLLAHGLASWAQVAVNVLLRDLGRCPARR